MIKSNVSSENELYEIIMANLIKEIDQKTFKIEEMPDYIKKAKEYAGSDLNLLQKIIDTLKLNEFQSDQISFIKKWDKTLIISQECGFPKEVFYTSRKVDKAFDFFKKNFFWGVMVHSFV